MHTFENYGMRIQWFSGRNRPVDGDYIYDQYGRLIYDLVHEYCRSDSMLYSPLEHSWGMVRLKMKEECRTRNSSVPVTRGRAILIKA